MFRVTNSMMANNLKQNISRNMRNLDTIENQISTGKKINKPSDDPAGLVRSLRLRTDMVENEQFISNIDDSISFLDTTDSALNNLNTALSRIRELMVQGANESSQSAYDAIKTEIDQLTEQIKTVANSTYGSKYVFAGSNVTETPCTDSGWTGNSNALVREIGQGVTMQVNVDMKDWFVGGVSKGATNSSYTTVVASDNSFQITIDGDTTGPHTINLSVGTTGADAIAADMQNKIRTTLGAINDGYKYATVTYTNGRYIISSGTTGENSKVEITDATANNVADDLKIGTSNGGTETPNIFNLINQVTDALTSGNNETVDSLLGEIDVKLDDIETTWAVVGAKTNRLEMQKTRLESNQESYTELLSKNEDADMAELAINLKTQENVYNASLSVGASIIQPTLLDFLD